MEPEQIWKEACKASKIAARDVQSSLPPERQRGFDCGFAWVSIRRARGEFIKYLKAIGVGRSGVYDSNGGYGIWCSELHDEKTQSVDVHYAAAKACANVLQKYGLNAHANSRLD